MVKDLNDQCELFRILFKRVAFVGSYYEDLKISRPDEFDLNIVLQFPFDRNYVVQQEICFPAHMKIRCPNRVAIPQIENSWHSKQIVR
jgi:hypothetical protein